MPIYEYACENCEKTYEKLVLSGNGTPECPHCGSKRATLQFSVFAAHSGNGAATSSGAAPSGLACGCTPRSCGCK